MKKVFQTLFGEEKGNCFQAAVASILEMDLEQVPHFCKDNPNDDWYFAFVDWLRSFGFSAIHIAATPEVLESANLDGCYIIVSGKSPRGLQHSCVYRGKRLKHDPIKGMQGVKPMGIDIIFPVDPAEVKRG